MARPYAAALILAFCVLSQARPATAEQPVEVTAEVDGRPLTEASERRPLRLDPDEPVTLDLRINNRGGDAATIRAVRFEGRVMGLAFFAYDTQVDLRVGADRTATVRYPLDLVGLSGQATGLIPARVVVLDADREPVASQAAVVDVRGSLWSVYGAFGLAVAAFTALSTASALLALARHQLAPNRWRRGVRFCWSGIGLGLLVIFTSSALRVFVPEPSRWVPILVVTTVTSFALGYLTPSPDDADDQDADDQDDLDEPDREGEPDEPDEVTEPSPSVEPLEPHSSTSAVAETEADAEAVGP